jgi:hypothetical protein
MMYHNDNKDVMVLIMSEYCSSKLMLHNRNNFRVLTTSISS